MASPHVQHFLKTIGRKGGKQRAKNLNARTRTAQAHKAIIARWIYERFGVDHFKSLALPGAEIVDHGLRDLVSGHPFSEYALAVMELRPRLRFLGVPVPDLAPKDFNAREQLFRKMETEHGGMSHARFCSLLERLDSFCDALASLAAIPKEPSHKNRRWCA